MVSLKATQQRIDEEAKELDDLINTFEETVRKLQRRGYKLFDKENEEYYLTGNVEFDRKKMAFLIEFDKEMLQ